MKIPEPYKVLLFVVLAVAMLMCYELITSVMEMERDRSSYLKLRKTHHLKMKLWSESEDLHFEQSFIDITTEIDIDCPKSVRIGSRYDGGWNLCEVGNLLPKKPCIIYSFGIGKDWSFDDGIMKRYGCYVRSFDPNISTISHARKRMNSFLSEGLYSKDIILNTSWRMNTLKKFREIFKDDSKVIDYIKIDVEGAEWDALNTSINDGSLLKVKQIAFEIHTDELYNRTTTTPKYKYFIGIYRSLRDLGFFKWYFHINPYSEKVISNLTGNVVWCCYELVFLNINYL